MNKQTAAPKPATALAPIFDSEAWGLTEQQARLTTLARDLAAEKFAPRAADYDRRAAFPTENYRDMAEAGLLGICVPEHLGGSG
ncbi:MAG: acyl-CoA dehydrogenase family protein, partial [Pseudomonadota bacterium]